MDYQIPACADLKRFTDLLDKKDGLFIKDLPVGIVLLLVLGDGSTIRLAVMDPYKSEVKLRIYGSKDLDGEYDGILEGSSFGGSMLKTGWISTGLCLEIIVPATKTRIKAWIKAIAFVTATSDVPENQSVN